MILRSLKKNRVLLLLSLAYFVLRLINLTIIPIFNDESIYLDWGWRELHTPNSLYYSLFDGKQPLLMWVFGFVQQFFDDPLFAGRLVSVITGFITMLGIYGIGKKYFSIYIANIASMFYIVTPIFSFYDRQALMESSMSMVMVWSIYVFLLMLERHSTTVMVALGALLGLGFFIKSTTILFCISLMIIYLVMQCSRKLSVHIQNRNIKLDTGFSLFISLIILLPLLSQQQFWETLSMNNRYSFTVGELMRFPIVPWLSNVKNILDISFWHITPFVLIAAFYGIYIEHNKVPVYRKLILYYVLVCMACYVFLSRSPSPRYTVSFLPLITLFVASALHHIIVVRKLIGKLFIIVCVISALSLTLLQIFMPLKYFSILDRITIHSGKSEYVTGWTSGYGVVDAVNFLKGKQKPLIVGLRVDSGNPENAIISYFHNSDTVMPGYFDSVLITADLSHIDCITFPSEFYFVSRGPQLAGLEKYLVEVTRYKKPEGEEFVGIYTIKSPCNGKTLKMNDIL